MKVLIFCTFGLMITAIVWWCNFFSNQVGAHAPPAGTHDYTWW